MFCCVCQRDLVDCTCPDIEERLNSLRNTPGIHVPSMVDKPLALRALKEDNKKKKVKKK